MLYNFPRDHEVFNSKKIEITPKLIYVQYRFIQTSYCNDCMKLDRISTPGQTGYYYEMLRDYYY